MTVPVEMPTREELEELRQFVDFWLWPFRGLSQRDKTVLTVLRKLGVPLKQNTY